ncbi:Gfo/Idh/MocA family protein [Nocardioides acrostichi]|uniref:Inositol 2-dehydrogenase n=1 Tax=Nocardioides acrostichi TaxID=2784339 RepID=A0A930UYS4_9ACTN|nr:Gfo/Idh/MocA family oxidoreductase [Nocardioides acrostichi]MBF4163363.1 Gfo/Idh/MocA family oxidoreductase [Nocardioides acrostichi]
MTVRIGVIGTGMIGQQHIHRLDTLVPGAAVTAVTDHDGEVAARVADGLDHDVTVHPDGFALIKDPEVDAVVVTSWGPTHAEFVLAAIGEGKHVFCEKPLATTQEDTLRIIEAEVAHGSRLVQVGFMRRYDAAYRAMKQTIADGAIGAPLVFYSGHRNPDVPAAYTREMAIVDTAVHDFDVARWLLDAEITAISVIAPRSNRHGLGRGEAEDLQDPLLMTIETSTGAVICCETSVNIRYGYDIRGEVVGEDGTVSLADRGLVQVRTAGTAAVGVPGDFASRFHAAFDVELTEWVAEVAAGSPLSGPSSWDGYASAAVCDAGVEALQQGRRVSVDLVEQPALYR